jgi:hypothetical protein
MKYRKCPRCEDNYITEEEELCRICIADSMPKQRKQPNKTFYGMGLRLGDVIEFIHDKKYTAVISGEDTVRLDGREMNITQAMYELYTRIGKKCTIGSGFEVFRFDDQDPNLYSRWDRLNKEIKD